MTVVPVSAVQLPPLTSVAPTPQLQLPLPPTPQVSAGSSFSQMLTQGVEDVNSKLVAADQQVRDFALDDSVPVHQVTYALEQARLSFEVMLHMRNRLLEGYQQLMNMQL